MRSEYPFSRVVLRAAFAVLAALVVAACSSTGGSPSAVIDELRATDLSPHYPSKVKQTDHGGQRPPTRQAELYPGEERRISATRGSAARNAVQKAADGYQLNFENAPLADVAKAVLGDTLQQPYILDPRVQGQVTLSTGRPVSRDELVKVFEMAVRLNSGALVSDGGGYRIIPAAEASSGEAVSVQPFRRGEPMTPGFGVTVMPLRHVASEAMLRLIDGFLARSGNVRAEATGNLLLIRGAARERESIADIVDTFDVDWLKGQSAGIFPLAHANPDELMAELNQVMQAEQPTLSSGMVRFQPIARLNAILVVARRFEHLQAVGAWIRRLDKSNEAGHNVYVYQVENGKAAEIAQVLNDTFGSTGGSGTRTAKTDVAPGRDVLQQSLTGGASGQGKSAQQPLAGQQPVLGSGSTAATNVNIVNAVPQKAPAGSSLGTAAAGGHGAGAMTDVRIIADEPNNSLLIRASQSDYQKILAALRRIDRAPLQVLINATIAEVTLNDGLRYGVQAYLKGKWGSVGYHPGPVDLTLTPAFPGLNLLVGSVADPRVVLDALSEVTSVKVVSSPSVVVLDNQPATLKVGDEVPITVQQSQSVLDPNAPIINSIRFRETGVILKVTPRVNSNGLVTMDVDQEISQVANNNDGTTTTTTLTPTISQRRLASTVSVYSGQTVALGGLISEQENSDKKSVPILNRVPVVGDLVGKTTTDRKRTELIVFIKPEVIRNGEDASRVSEELRAKLKSLAFKPQPDRRDLFHDRTPPPSTKDAAMAPRGCGDRQSDAVAGCR